MKNSKRSFELDLSDALDIVGAGLVCRSLSDEEIHIIATLIDVGSKERWSYRDIYDLALAIAEEDGNWLYALNNQYNLEIPVLERCEVYTPKEYLSVFNIQIDDTVEIKYSGDIDDIIDAAFILDQVNITKSDLNKAKKLRDDVDLSESPTATCWNYLAEDFVECDPDDDKNYAIIVGIKDEHFFYELPEESD